MKKSGTGNKYIKWWPTFQGWTVAIRRFDEAIVPSFSLTNLDRRTDVAQSGFSSHPAV